MKKRTQILLIALFVIMSIGIILTLILLEKITFPTQFSDINYWNALLWIVFVVSYILVINESINWVKNGKRSEWADIIAIVFIGISVYLITQDPLTSFMGAFSIYLIFGLYELKDYEVLNKIVLITVISYNFIFISGLLDKILVLDGRLRDTAFSLSFFVILILGFIIFGRKYIVVFRFMSAQYLTLVFYLVAWLGIVTLNKITNQDFSKWVYEIIIGFNILVYLTSGFLLDWMMGYKKTDDPELNALVQEVAENMGLNPKRIKVRYGKYPILNAMAYGCYGLDMHMALIAPDLKFGKGGITKDEIRGVIAHELAHLKGKHTLILTAITTIQLIIYKFVGLPASFFDYTFADKDTLIVDLWVYLLINFAITIVLYIFVRILESFADMNSRKAGYQTSLAQGLYNLESFYATSHEIGLDATLLSDEKLTEQNRQLNYLTTAIYLNQNMINPSRGALLSNLINAHPPSYHRILAIMNPNEISPFKEALLPFTLLSKRKVREFYQETQEARNAYIQIAAKKIKSEFNLSDISEIYKKLNSLQFHQHKIGRTFAYQHYGNGERIFATVKDIFLIDNAASPYRYSLEVILSSGNLSKTMEIDPMLYKEVPISIHSKYNFKKYGVVEMDSIDLNQLYLKKKNSSSSQKKEKSLSYQFKNMGVIKFRNPSDNSIIEKPLFKTKLSQPLEYLQNLLDRPLYYHYKGLYLPYLKDKLTFSDDFHSLTLDLKPALEKTENSELNGELHVSLEEFVFKFKNLHIPIHGDSNSLETEVKLFKFFQTQNQQLYFILKKAVNSEILGTVMNVEEKYKEDGKLSKTSMIHYRTCFNEEAQIELKKIDSIYYQQPTIIIKPKKDMSFLSILFGKISARLKPEGSLVELHTNKKSVNDDVNEQN